MNYKASVKIERVMAVIVDSIVLSVLLNIAQIIYRPLLIEGESFGNISEAIPTPFFQEDVPPEALAVNIIVSFLIGVLLFIVIPYNKNGKTLGKMLFSIRAIDTEGNNPSLKQHALRAIDIYNTYLYMVILWVVFIDVELFFELEVNTMSLVGLVVIVSFFMIVMRRDARGLHDFLARTYVVHENYDPQQHNTDTIRKDWAGSETTKDILDETEDDTDPFEDDDPWNK